MKFVIKDKDGKVLFSTECPHCIPLDKIDSMNSAGLQFYVDSKRISAANVKLQFKNNSNDLLKAVNTDDHN